MNKKDLSRVNYQGCSVLYFDDDPGVTEQHHRDVCDINYIIAKFSPDALALHAQQYNGQYGDFSELPDYHTALSTVRQIDDLFMNVPADIRAKFNNDPGSFIQFVENPDNRDAMAELGLISQSFVQESLKSVDEVNETPSST